MAHFAKISEDNIVLFVTPLEDKYMLDENNNVSESIGQAYLEKHNNWPAHLWIQTSYNTHQNKHKFGGTPFRGNYAGIGFTWDPENQMFWPAKQYPSWIKNLQESRWQSPVGDSPEDKNATDLDKVTNPLNYPVYYWDENSQNWVKLRDYYSLSTS
jgi:hypothetical protein